MANALVSIANYNALMYKISKGMNNADFETMKLIVKDEVPINMTEQVNKPAFFTKLRHAGLIDEGNVSYLKDILQMLEKTDLLRSIEEYEQKLAASQQEQGQKQIQEQVLSMLDEMTIGCNGAKPKIQTEHPAPRQETAGKSRRLDDIREKKRNLAQATEANRVRLYGYQEELVTPGIEGLNYIMYAPTGTGKTIAAGYICHNKWQKAKEENRPFKALFLVNIRNLIKQQKEALRKMFPNDDISVVDGISEKNDFIDLMNYDNTQIIVVTAQILVNWLGNYEGHLDEFQLVILDECHHTTLEHPYSKIMRHYFNEKRDNHTMPQVIGLTASLGVGEKDDAKDHYIDMCANLDCHPEGMVTHVRDPEHKKELRRKNPSLIERVRNRDTNDLFIHELTKIVKQLQKQSPGSAQVLLAPCGTLQYEADIVKYRQEAEKKGDTDAIFVCETLRELNRALLAYGDLRAKDVIPALKNYFLLRPDKLRDISHFAYCLYDSVAVYIDDIAEVEEVKDNPKLCKLHEILQDIYTNNPQSRGIILARTRANVEGLVSFVKDQSHLKDMIRCHNFWGKGQGERSMTDAEQDKALNLFRTDFNEGGVNLLISTDILQEALDIPQCNFVIRYNFVSNEIGGVQSRGRARAEDSVCFLIVNRGSLEEKRERNNKLREADMEKALDLLDEDDPNELQKQMIRRQEKMRNAQEEKENNPKPQPGEKTIHCRACQRPLCLACDIRLRGSNYIVTDPSYENTVRIKPTMVKDFPTEKHIARIFCGNPECKEALGIKLEYKQGTRLYGYIISKDAATWREVINGMERFHTIKKWSKVPFLIEEEKIKD